LSVDKVLEKLWMNVHEILGVVSLVARNNRLDFGGDLHSDLDPGILFLHIFAVCKIAILYYYLQVDSTIVSMIHAMSLISLLFSVYHCELKHIPWRKFILFECFLVYICNNCVLERR